MKPARHGYDNLDFINTAIKPENQEVKLEVGVDTGNSHYDTNKGTAIATNAEIALRKNEEDERIFNRFVAFVMKL